MRKMNITKLILESMPPANNEFQEQLKDYLETHISEVNQLIYSTSKFRSIAEVIFILLTQLRIDLAFQIFMEEGDFNDVKY